jgi:hypothetical protein
MSGDDKHEKTRLVPLNALSTLEDTGKVLLRAHDALVLHELQQVLARQAERDLIVEEMRSIIDTLSVGHIMAIEEIKQLKHAHVVLLRQQAELRERQDMISAICDAFAAKLEKETQGRLKLAEEVGDND